MQEHFQALNNYYDKIYILSLPRLRERIAYINETCRGLKFDFFWGADKESTSIEDLKNKNLYSTKRFQSFYKKPKDMPPGMLCCSLGHLQIYQDIIKNRYQRSLILEDDVVPLIENFNHFPDIITDLPADWDLLYLGYEKNEIYGLKEKIKQQFYKLFPPYTRFKITKEIFSNYYPQLINKHIAKAGFHDCTHAYSVTLQGTEKLVAMQTPVAFHPDNLISYMACTGNLKAFISRPKLFNQLTAFNNQVASLTSPDAE